MQVALDIRAHHGLKTVAARAKILNARIKAPVILIGQHIAVVGIEQHKSFRNRLDGVGELLLRGLQRLFRLLVLSDVLGRPEEADAEFRPHCIASLCRRGPNVSRRLGEPSAVLTPTFPLSQSPL